MIEVLRDGEVVMVRVVSVGEDERVRWGCRVLVDGGKEGDEVIV